MKKCTHCKRFKGDKEYNLTTRMGIVIEDGGLEKLGKVSYVQSWCKSCTVRLARLKRGKSSSLDIGIEIAIDVDNRW